MRAFGITAYQQPLSALEVPEPTVGPRDVLIEVAAAGLNHLDEKLRVGEFKAMIPAAMPLVLGHDVAGTVVRLGTEVTRFVVGDTVFGRPGPTQVGTFTERLAVAESDLAHAPTTLTLEEAAGLPLVALTAWQALVEIGQLAAGQKVLVHAGAGAVGSIAIQLAKHLGATVATTAGGEGIDRVRALGADVVIDYRTQDFAAELSGYDLVLDSLGGDNLLRSLTVLRRGGTAVGIAGPPEPTFARAAGLNPVLRLAITALSSKVRRRAATLGVTYRFLFMHADGDQLRRLTALIDDATISPLPVQSYPFEQAPQALADLAAGQLRAKAVLTRS